MILYDIFFFTYYISMPESKLLEYRSIVPRCNYTIKDFSNGIIFFSQDIEIDTNRDTVYLRPLYSF